MKVTVLPVPARGGDAAGEGEAGLSGRLAVDVEAGLVPGVVGPGQRDLVAGARRRAWPSSFVARSARWSRRRCCSWARARRVDGVDLINVRGVGGDPVVLIVDARAVPAWGPTVGRRPAGR